jgi:hypothetical protein
VLGTADVVLELVWSIIASVRLVSDTVLDNVTGLELVVIGTELAVSDVIMESERFGREADAECDMWDRNSEEDPVEDRELSGEESGGKIRMSGWFWIPVGLLGSETKGCGCRTV